jgi:hypothetical protein
MEMHFSVNEGYVGVWCVPSAIHVSHIYGSRNKVLGIRVFDTLIYEPPWYVTNCIHVLIYIHLCSVQLKDCLFCKNTSVDDVFSRSILNTLFQKSSDKFDRSHSDVSNRNKLK